MMGLRTSEGLSESVTAQQVLSSIIMFGVIYSLLFAVWIYVLNAKIKHGPESVAELQEHKRQHHESLLEKISHSSKSHGGSLLEDEK